MNRNDDTGPSDIERARGREAGDEATEPVQPQETSGGAATAVAEAESPFFAGDEGGRFRAEWQRIQTAFVDDPRAAVEQADRLVTQVIERLVGVFGDERARLEGQWARGGEAETEHLRVALQRYRAFFGRLLSI
jgi:hypothetical protein